MLICLAHLSCLLARCAPLLSKGLSRQAIKCKAIVGKRISVHLVGCLSRRACKLKSWHNPGCVCLSVQEQGHAPSWICACHHLASLDKGQQVAVPLGLPGAVKILSSCAIAYAPFCPCVELSAITLTDRYDASELANSWPVKLKPQVCCVKPRSPLDNVTHSIGRTSLRPAAFSKFSQRGMLHQREKSRSSLTFQQSLARPQHRVGSMPLD